MGSVVAMADLHACCLLPCSMDVDLSAQLRPRPRKEQVAPPQNGSRRSRAGNHACCHPTCRGAGRGCQDYETGCHTAATQRRLMNSTSLSCGGVKHSSIPGRSARPGMRRAGASAAASAAEAQQILYRRGQRQQAEFEERPPSQGEARRWERSGRFSKKVLVSLHTWTSCPSAQQGVSCCSSPAHHEAARPGYDITLAPWGYMGPRCRIPAGRSCLHCCASQPPRAKLGNDRQSAAAHAAPQDFAWNSNGCCVLCAGRHDGLDGA